MTDEAKALVKWLRSMRSPYTGPAADLIETQAREIERLRNAMVVMDNTYGVCQVCNRKPPLDREAVRAEQAAELAKFKALAETLAGALEHITDIEPDPANMGRFHDIANEALRARAQIEGGTHAPE